VIGHGNLLDSGGMLINGGIAFDKGWPALSRYERAARFRIGRTTPPAFD